VKIFISADIEGVTTSTSWDDAIPGAPGYAENAKQMTNEVLACIRGAKNAGATEFIIKDAHAGGCNIDPAAMPEGAVLLPNKRWPGRADHELFHRRYSIGNRKIIPKGIIWKSRICAD